MKNNNEKKKTRNKKNLTFTLRFAVLGILGILLIYSAASAYNAYQTPLIKKIMIPALQYSHTGQFDYTVLLKNSTVYNNQTILGPGEGTIFRQLVNTINASFTDTFEIDHDATISGNYTINAILQTNLWMKTYPLIPKTPFKAQGTTAQFITFFPINCTHYESLLKEVNDETGVPAQNPQLIIQCIVIVHATSGNHDVSSVFSPSINVSLNQKILDVSKDLTSYQPGMVTTSTLINQQNSPDQWIFWTALSLVFLGVMAILPFLPSSISTSEDRTQNELKKIKKKYGDWIVETTTYPLIPISKSISVKSLEDLSKVSEELGKPILLYTSPNKENHTFYILDENVVYEYSFTPEDMVKITTRCPRCGTQITYEEYPGKKIDATCPICGTTGIIFIDKQNKNPEWGHVVSPEQKK